MSRRLVCHSRSPDETRIIASEIASLLLPGDVVALSGDLGAGKTCFVQGAARELGVTDRVTSPTFVLVREYQGRFTVLHIDVYRLGNLQELVDLGYEEFLDPNCVVFIEWGDAVGPLLPSEYLAVELRALSDDTRAMELDVNGPSWEARAPLLREKLARWSREAS